MSAQTMTETSSLIWFRNDLRLRDNPALTQALNDRAVGVGVYCYDPRQFAQTALGFAKTGGLRANFLRQSVEALKADWQRLGGQFLVTCGYPEVVIPQVARAIQAKTVYYQREVTAEEVAVETQLTQALTKERIQSVGVWGATLFHPDDLPFPITDLPDLFTRFRKLVEKNKTPVCSPLPSPHQIAPLTNEQRVKALEPFQSRLPDPDWFTTDAPDPQGVMIFNGGETAAWQRLQDYFWQGDYLQRYKETRNGLLGANYSSKFSPWLALGCLSPRLIYAEVKRYEQERVKNDSTYWLIFELLWRDFFRFVAQKYGDRLFYRRGLLGVEFPWQQDVKRFHLWQAGRTGYPLVDANMRELQRTGFMSNRGRQNMASFLCKNLGIDWRWGAQWFESCLLDYDVCSNWGNWNYTAGVGNDARGFRYFNIPKQSQQYDPGGHYLRHWLPELASLPGDKIHEPWRLSQGEQKQFGVQLGVDYPRPCVDFFQSVKANEKKFSPPL